jgi:hypothetical protein
VRELRRIYTYEAYPRRFDVRFHPAISMDPWRKSEMNCAGCFVMNVATVPHDVSGSDAISYDVFDDITGAPADIIRDL